MIIFENSSWILSAKGNRLIIKSKQGLGTATASLVGTPYRYSSMGMYNRGQRIVYKNEGIVPAYIRSKVTNYFRRG